MAANELSYQGIYNLIVVPIDVLQLLGYVVL